MDLASLITCGVLGVLLVYEKLTKDKQINKLLNRVMAGDYEKYQYYEEKFKGDVKEVEALRAEARKERAGESELKPLNRMFKEDTVDDFTAKLEEDWGEEEIDIKRVKVEDES